MNEKFQTSLTTSVEAAVRGGYLLLALYILLTVTFLLIYIIPRKKDIPISSWLSIQLFLSVIGTLGAYLSFFHRSVIRDRSLPYEALFFLFLLFTLFLFIPFLVGKLSFEKLLRGSYFDSVGPGPLIVGIRRLWNGKPSMNPHFFILSERSLYTNIHCVGGIGSGKTTTIVYPILQQILLDRRSKKRPAVFLIDVKGSVVDDLRAWDHPRRDDVVILGYGYEKVNILDSDDALIAANNLITGFSGYKKDQADPFYRSYQETYLRNAMCLLFEYVRRDRSHDAVVRSSPVKLNALRAEIQKLESAASDGQRGRQDKLKNLRRDEARWGALASLLKVKCFNAAIVTLEELFEFIADKEARTAVIVHARDYIHKASQGDRSATDPKHLRLMQASLDYFRSVEEDKTTYLAGLLSDISTLMTDKIKNYFTAPVKFDFAEAIHNGKIVVVNVPEGQFGDISKLVALQFLLQYQKAVLKRMDPSFNMIEQNRAVPYNTERTCFIILDEVQKFMCAELANFSAVSRQARACTIALHQDLGQIPEEYQTSFLANIRTKIVLNINDYYTADYFSKFFGEHQTSRITRSKSKVAAGSGWAKSWTSEDKPRFRPQDIIQLPKNKAIISHFDGDQVNDPRIIDLIPFYLPLYNLFARRVPGETSNQTSANNTGDSHARIIAITTLMAAESSPSAELYAERGFLYGNLGNIAKCREDLASAALIYQERSDEENFRKIRDQLTRLA